MVGDIALLLEAGARWSDTQQGVGRSAQRHDERARGGLCWSEAPARRRAVGVLGSSGAVAVADSEISSFSQSSPGVLLAGGMTGARGGMMLERVAA